MITDMPAYVKWGLIIAAAVVVGAFVLFNVL